MQEPGKLDLKLYQGATFDYLLTWVAGGTPVNLSGFDARMQVRSSFASPTPVFDLVVGSGIVLGGTAGTIGLSVDAGDTSLGFSSTQSFVYDLELVDSLGVVVRLVEGTFMVFPEVTR